MDIVRNFHSKSLSSCRIKINLCASGKKVEPLTSTQTFCSIVNKLNSCEKDIRQHFRTFKMLRSNKL